jgi:serpin B
LLVTVVVLLSAVSFVFAQPVSNLSQSDNQFAFDLYSRLSSNKGNIFFSPYSLSSALDMTYEGARGETAQEMRAVLHLSVDDASRRVETSAFIQNINRPDKSYELSVANALWAQKAYPFKEDYLSLVKGVYSALARNLDFVADPQGSRGTINNWVSENTNNRINDLLPSGSITKDTRLVLTDAVYFKGKWLTPFKKQDTKPDIFWLGADQSVQTDMMALLGKPFKYAENDQAQLLELPYLGNDLSMLIILPRSKDIKDLEKVLTLDMLKQWQEGMLRLGADVYLPKFKFDSSLQMSDILTGMGMKLAFDARNADFSGMANLIPGERLYIGGVFHKAWIDTSEEGTEAAAATAVVMFKAMAMPMRMIPKIFRADHPFIFVIQENKTGHILFMGRVSDPRS